MSSCLSRRRVREKRTAVSRKERSGEQGPVGDEAAQGMSRGGYDLQRNLGGIRDGFVETSKELQQQGLPVGGHLVETLENERAAGGGQGSGIKAGCVHGNEGSIAGRTETMQFGGDERFSGAAFSFNRADAQVRDGALHLFEQALNGG